eukprot:NODE_29063_length_457_cov_5.745455.p6 GENE.NODE_29063_length_457_cov_5.745455~~NODE_29063_length_457_cov_5.745455.p6  ORF type:complete len:55 (+),score=10.08 NODE_29063_length_457_cov_5.745455:149-313(+)
MLAEQPTAANVGGRWSLRVPLLARVMVANALRVLLVAHAAAAGAPYHTPAAMVL